MAILYSRKWRKNNMAQTTNKFQIIQKVSAEDTVLIHPETEAEVVKYSGTAAGISAENVQGAIDEVYEQVKGITGGGIVTGIKGDKETAYRKGAVNLTTANIGAEPSGAVNTHDTSGTAHSDIRTAVTNAQNKANSAYALAEGRAKAISFDTIAAMTTALKAAAKTDYKVGDNIFIKALDTPDYWVSKVLDNNTGTYGYFEISALESQKVDLAAYQTKTDNTLATTAKTVVGAIGEVKTTADAAKSQSNTNVTEIANIKNGTTKVGAATKADKATSADTATSATSAGKWTAARTLGVSVNSGVKKDGSTAISGSGSQSVDGSANKTVSVTLGDSGVTAGTYSAVQVNAKGIAVAGGQMIEIGTSGQTAPSASLATGGLFFKVV
jgi:hypothetical protein